VFEGNQISLSEGIYLSKQVKDVVNNRDVNDEKGNK
jgi:hypothetical protein